MELKKLNPILKKESILKTANAAELEIAPNDVLERYQSYAMTHVPLGDTKEQMAKLERVITQNKRCAIGNIVGPYGYGKTSTAVHLWNELRKKQILAVPPFQWSDLEELLNAVYHWTRFEFSLGPKQFIPQLDVIFKQYSQQRLEEVSDKFGADTIRKLAEGGYLRLKIQASDIVGFYSDVSNLGIEAGFQGLAVFTDELQATIAAYQPSRDQFYADLFQIVKDVLGLTGQWAIVLTMDDGTEGIIARDRSDMLHRMQQSALYFRVKDVYNRRERREERSRVARAPDFCRRGWRPRLWHHGRCRPGCHARRRRGHLQKLPRRLYRGPARGLAVHTGTKRGRWQYRQRPRFCTIRYPLLGILDLIRIRLGGLIVCPCRSPARLVKRRLHGLVAPGELANGKIVGLLVG